MSYSRILSVVCIALLTGNAECHADETLCPQIKLMYDHCNPPEPSWPCPEIGELIAEVADLKESLSWYKASNGYSYKVFTTKVNYATAKGKCVERGGILASLGPRDAHVRGELVRLMKLNNDDIWIGVNDIIQEGVWVWEDGTTSSSDIDWASSQPDNDGKVGDCAHYRPRYNWMVNDEPCDRLKMYLCEKAY